MEILSNFSSAYCFISFILGALFMLTMLCIAAMGKVQEQCNKVQEPMNNVHFYVARDKNGKMFLYMGKPIRKVGIFASSRFGHFICQEKYFSKYCLNARDFDNLKWEDEPVEVFITLND